VNKDIKKLRHLRRLARIAAKAFKLPLRELYINECLESQDMWGGCYWEYGTIEIRLRTYEGGWLNNKLVIDTLAHELAHLVEPGHGKAHKLLWFAIAQMLQRY
jgi:predicted metal-dependent hydrolase